MLKNASIVSLALASSLTLWGCKRKTDDLSTVELFVKTFDDATKAYGEACKEISEPEACKDACNKITIDLADKIVDLEMYQNKDSSPSSDDKEKVEENKNQKLRARGTLLVFMHCSTRSILSAWNIACF